MGFNGYCLQLIFGFDFQNYFYFSRITNFCTYVEQETVVVCSIPIPILIPKLKVTVLAPAKPVVYIFQPTSQRCVLPVYFPADLLLRHC